MRRWRLLVQPLLWGGLLASGAYLVLRAAPAPIAGRPVVVATGLDLPRGLSVDTGGTIWVAEGGGRLSRVAPTGERTTIMDGLPKARDGPDLMGALGGPVATAYVGEAAQPYLLVGHGPGEQAFTLFRVHGAGATHRVADLRAAPTIRPGLAQAPVAMAAGSENTLAVLDVSDGLYLVTVDSDAPNLVEAQIRLLAALPMGMRPVGLTRATGAPYEDGWLVAQLGPPPYLPGTGSVLHVDWDGRIRRVAAALTTPSAAVAGGDGKLYVLELSSGTDPGNERLPARSGRLLALDGLHRRVLAAGLDYPLSMAFAPNGDLYIATGSVLSAGGRGQIVRVPADVIAAGGRPLAQ